MPDQIYIGNYPKGLKLDRTAFNIDNDAFPMMFNFYTWRGRAKRKRGTSPLARLQRQIESVAVATNPWEFGPLVLAGGAGNLISGFSLESGSSIAPGSIEVVVGANTYTEPATPDGTLIGLPAGSGTINYATGAITITGGGAGPLTGTFSYFPSLPVLGLEDFVPNNAASEFPLLIAFDTTYAYQINQSGTPFFYNVSYYKNSNVPFIWSNVDSAQFWSTNYQSAFWVTNNKPGLHFVNGMYSAGSGTNTITFNFKSLSVNFPDLVVGDKLWFNEWNVPTAQVTNILQTVSPSVVTVITANNTFSAGQKVSFSGIIGMTQLNVGIYNITAATPTDFTIDVDSSEFDEYETGGIATLEVTNVINTLTGTVTDATGAAAGNYVVTFDNTQTVSGEGIAILLTNSIPGQDGIKWYDGDPTSGSGIPTGTNLGWSNFSPPLTETNVSINSQTAGKYYLVGALAILPFKDRLLFFGPQIQTSTGPVIQRPLQDTVLWSWDGTPYYSNFVPTNFTSSETSDPTAYYVDQTGKGGFLPAGISQPIKTVTNNEDVLLIGFGGAGKKTRFVFTGNDLQPFLFYLINGELPSSSTFSAINMDRGGIDVGSYGITITTQQSCSRIDLDIPDSVFQIQALNSGQDRVNAIRDYYKEWIYFSYPIGNGVESNSSWKFPTQTFMYNYRDNTWGIFRENYTHHGSFRKSTYFTWATCPFETWASWEEPWDAGSSTALFPSIIGGNPQGYVVIKDTEGTFEAPSGSIAAIANDGLGFTQITSVDHCVNIGDYLYFLSCIGSTYLNGEIGLVTATPDADTFVVDIIFVAGTYLGLGTFTRLCQPLLQTKQFPFYWDQGRQVRLGVQKYLMDFTADAQCTVNIYLSQDNETPYNFGNIIPSIDVLNNSLEYSSVLFTCPESTNIGLTPANTNLQMPIAEGQNQIWHRMNTSLIGNTFQIGLTLSDEQMRNLTFATSEITLHGMHFTVSPGPLLS